MTVLKTLESGTLVTGCMCHAGDNGGARKIVDIGGNARLASRAGKS